MSKVDKKFYLAGGMSGLSREEQANWRWEVISRIKEDKCEIGYEYKPVFFNPMIHYNLFDNEHKTEREPFEFDLYNLRDSDVVLVNFNSPQSIGTAMELAVAKEHKKPIVGLNENGYDLHPWLIECCTRICDTMDEFIAHVECFYLT